MHVVDVITFDQALDASSGCKNRHLLLGNGFSIACFPKIFPYSSLFEEAKSGLPDEVIKVFETLGTTDFEAVTRALQSSAAIAPIYSASGADVSEKMVEHAELLKEANSEQKLKKIQHSAYLHHAYKSYVGVLRSGKASALIVLGHSLDQTDDHIFERIAKSQLAELYVSLHGDVLEPNNIEIIRRAERLKAKRSDEFPLHIGYFDAASAAPWG